MELDFYTIKWLTVSHRSPESSAFSHKGTLPYLPQLRSQTCFRTIQHQNSMRHSLSPPLTALKIGHCLSCTTFWVEHPATTPDSPTRVFLIDFFMKFIMQNVLYHLDSHLTCCTEIYVYILLIWNINECPPVWFTVCWISKNVKKHNWEKSKINLSFSKTHPKNFNFKISFPGAPSIKTLNRFLCFSSE